MGRKNIWKNAVVFVVFFAVSLCLLMRPIDDLDELWNYNFAHNLCNGLTPYVEFNCIVTPFSIMVAAGFLSIFGNSLLMFRILSGVLLAVICFLLFLLLAECGKNRVLAFVGASVAFALCYLIWIYNYNNLNLLAILLVMSLELQAGFMPEKKVFWKHLAAGFVHGLVFLSKQSVGALLLLYNAVVCLYFWVTEPQNRKMYFLRFAISLLPLLIFGGYLLATDSMAAFWDYAVVGVGTFHHYISYWQFMTSGIVQFAIGAIPFFVTIISLVAIKKRTTTIDSKLHIRLLAISWVGMSVAYPLCDYSHMCIAVVPFFVCGFCCMKKVTFNHKEGAVCMFVASFVLAALCISEYQIAKTCVTSKLHNYEGLPIYQALETHIQTVDDYIMQQKENGKQVLIADSVAAVYLLPLDIYYKDFSLLNEGNLGSQSIEQLLWRENAIYLIGGDAIKKNRQSCFELIAFITNQYTKIGEVSGFEAYQAK